MAFARPRARLVRDWVVVRDWPCLAVLEVAVDAREVVDLLGRQLVPLVAEALAHLHEEQAPVDELHLPFAVRLLPVREHPDVGRDARVVEKLVGECDDGLQPVVLDNPPADVALPAAGITREQGRSVEHDREAAAAFLGGLHLRKHVLQEQQRAVVDPGQARAEAAVVPERVRLAFDVALLLLPLHAEGRIGEHVVEGVLAAVGTAGVSVVREGVAEDDVLSVLSFQEHVGLADRP